MQIVIASTNHGKIAEINSIFEKFPRLNINLKSLIDYQIIEPDEPYDTFIENARHKAKYYATQTKTAALSEDAGLCIAALDGFPGVRTKEFAQECCGVEKAFIKLEQMLSGLNTAAYFKCAAALYLPELDQFITNEAIINGHLVFPPRGNQGFAFDPIFIPQNYDKTMAELGTTVKNKISHRALAIYGLAEKLAL